MLDAARLFGGFGGAGQPTPESAARDFDRAAFTAGIQLSSDGRADAIRILLDGDRENYRERLKTVSATLRDMAQDSVVGPESGRTETSNTLRSLSLKAVLFSGPAVLVASTYLKGSEPGATWPLLVMLAVLAVYLCALGIQDVRMIRRLYRRQALAAATKPNGENGVM